jgi:hypothetical protein
VFDEFSALRLNRIAAYAANLLKGFLPGFETHERGIRGEK